MVNVWKLSRGEDFSFELGAASTFNEAFGRQVVHP